MKRPLEEILKQDFSKFIEKENQGRAFFDLMDRIFLVSDLLKITGGRKEIKLIRCNAITNLVTSIEVFLKDMIVENPTWWSRKAVADLLDKKIPLSDAFEIAQIKNLKPEHLIIEVINFQNLKSIETTFTRLTESNFFHSIDHLFKTRFSRRMKSLRNWKKDMFSMYELRNKIVHEDFRPSLPNKVAKRYCEVALFFCLGFLLSEVVRINSISLSSFAKSRKR